MSDYQKVKARAQALQREKEEAVRREAAIKAERDKQLAKEEEERRHRREEQAKEARRIELTRANQALAEKAELDRRLREGKAPVTPIDGGEEYDPFAEDVRKPRPVQNANSGTTKATSRTKAKPADGAASTSHTSSSKPRPSTSKVSSTGSSTAKDRSSPPPLGRKEKAARLFAQQAIKSSRGESVFSIRDLVEGRESSGSAPPRASSHVKAEKSWTLTTRQRVNKDMHKEGLRKLCVDRDNRDRRSIDEIQRDARARKEAKLGNDKEKAKTDSTPVPKVRPKLPPIPTTARPAPTSHPPAPAPQRTGSPKRRRRSSSSSSSSYETDERPSKRGTFERSLPSQAAISAEIQALFRRPDRPAPKRTDWSDEDSDDMEAGLSDVEAEERRTAKIARLEDEAAEREERIRREDKERRKRERDKPKSKA